VGQASWLKSSRKGIGIYTPTLSKEAALPTIFLSSVFFLHLAKNSFAEHPKITLGKLLGTLQRTGFRSD